MVAADPFLVGRYLGHNMWCCSTAQPKFEWDLTLGPFSPNRDWREATGAGEDTICDFPFGCQNCECEPDGTDDAGRISAAGCPAEEPTPTPENPDQSWYPGLRQIPQTVDTTACRHRFSPGRVLTSMALCSSPSRRRQTTPTATHSR